MVCRELKLNLFFSVFRLKILFFDVEFFVYEAEHRDRGSQLNW